jgi:inorganic triphosphatase YgiF
MSGPQEIELKFLCAPEDLGAVLAAAPAGDDESRELISVYFDTPDLKLQKAGVSLRVRESKGCRVQTLKRGDGLAREEHEVAVAGDRPDPQMQPLPELLPNGEAAALRPAFNVRVTRRQRLLHYQGAEIELALDQGEVEGGTRRSPICEVELELKTGEPGTLFGLARELSRAAPLYLSFDGKAAQGHALVAGAGLPARRKEQPVLPAGATTAQAFQAMARHSLGQIAANAAVLREAADAEAVHQLRVASRRLRSILATFAPMLRGADLERLKEELRWLARACDQARNLDVFRERLEATAEAMDSTPAGLPPLREALAAARERAAAEAAEAARSARYRAMMIDLAEWIEVGPWLADDLRAELRRAPAGAYAAYVLQERRRKLMKRGRRLAHLDDAARHDVRIAAKKLRYSAEAFASLFPEKAVRRFVGRMKDLQDELGALNDLTLAEHIAEAVALPPDAAFAAGEITGVQACDKPARLAAAQHALRRLGKTAPFWR